MNIHNKISPFFLQAKKIQHVAKINSQLSQNVCEWKIVYLSNFLFYLQCTVSFFFSYHFPSSSNAIINTNYVCVHISLYSINFHFMYVSSALTIFMYNFCTSSLSQSTTMLTLFLNQGVETQGKLMKYFQIFLIIFF